jgi:hypothetical protein
MIIYVPRMPARRIYPALARVFPVSVDEGLLVRTPLATRRPIAVTIAIRTALRMC